MKTADEIASDSRRRAAATIHSLMSDLSAGIRVLRTRDGVAISDEQCTERAANILCGLMGNYRIEPLEPLVGVTYSRPAPTEQDFMDERIK